MANLIDSLHSEMNRLREIIKVYDTIPYGEIAAAFMRQSIKSAELAIQTGDVIAQLQVLEDLKGYEL